MRNASNRSPRPARFEVRAVWNIDTHCVSQPVAQFDVQPMHARKPDRFGVYDFYGYHVEDHSERVAAETHAAQLNGSQA